MKRALFLLGLLLASPAAAQAPSPAQMGITPTTTPEVLQTLDNTKTWVPLGTVDPLTHTFTPVGGGGGGGLSPIPADTTLGNITGAPALPQTLPLPDCSSLASALTYTLGTGFGCNIVAGALTAIPANNVLANATNSTALPVANPLPPCSTLASALTYTPGTGFGCNIIVPTGGTGATNASNGFINVTEPVIGFVPGGATDNSPMVPNIATALGSFGAYEVVIPGVVGTPVTTYYFSQPWHAARAARYRCVAPEGGAVQLVFAPGVDGFIQDAKSTDLQGCQVASAGYSTFWGNALTNNVVNVANYSGGLGGTPAVSWHVGDGFMASPAAAFYPVDSFPAYPMDTVVTGVQGGNFTGYIVGTTLTSLSGNPGIGAVISGGGVAASTYIIGGGPGTWQVNVSQTVGSAGAPVTMTATTTLTVSNTGSPYLGGNTASYNLPGIPNNGQAAAKGTAVFTQTGTNNFNSGDTINVAGVTYTFATILSNQHTVLRGLNFDASAANLVAAVMNTAGQYSTYVPSTSGRDLGLHNPFVTATHVSGSGVITFTSIWGGPAVNNFPSVYTTGGTAAGSFPNATFTGGDTLTSCPSPCMYINAPLSVWQLPATQQFNITTAIGNHEIGFVQPPLPHQPLFNGDKIWTAAFPFGTTIQYVHSAAQFVEAGTNNFNDGDKIQAGNNTFTFRTALTAAAGDVKIGVNFPTSLANLSEGIANAPAADRGVIFNPPTNVSNISIAGAIGPTWATFYGNVGKQALTDAYVAVYTPAGGAAGSFTTGATFANYVAADTDQPSFNFQLAVKTYPPGGEGPMWIMPVGLKKRTNATSSNLTLDYWGIGESMICSVAWGFNCDLSRDENNWHFFNIAGRWAEGDNYATASTKDEQFAHNYLADDLELGTLGESLYNPNFESTESGSAFYGSLLMCASQNNTTIYGGYIGGANWCSDQLKVFPGSPQGGMASLGLNSGGTAGFNFGGGNLCCGKSITVSGGNDGTGVTTLGGGSALLANALTFDTKIASTPTIGSLAWNAVNKEWQWSRGVGTPQIAMKFVGNESNNYAGPGTWIAAFTPGTLMGGDANSGNPHYFGMSTAKPSGTWHTQGSTQIVSNASPGAMGAWYSVGGSSSLVGVLNGTTLEVQQEIDNLPLPTLAAGGTGYASAAVTGTLTGALPGCTTQPVLAVTASAAGALTGITSVTTKGVCPPAATFTGTIALTNLTMPSVVGEIFPGDPVTGVGVTPGTTIVSGSGLAWVVTPSQTVGPVAMTAGALPTSSTAWTPGGALLAGTGAIVNLVWQQALTVTSSVLSGPPGLHQLLTGTSIVANTHIISGSGNFWGLDQTYASPLGPETITGQSWYPAMAVSNDPINPDFTAVALRSGSASNKDLTGRITLSGGAATYTLTGIYATPPDCVTADVTTPANSNSVLESTTVLTFSGTGTDTLKWVCAGRN